MADVPPNQQSPAGETSGTPEVVLQPKPSPSSPPVAAQAPEGSEMVADPSAKDFHRRSSTIKQSREIIKSRDQDVSLFRKLSDMIVPLAALGVLVVIVLFVFIPFGTEIIDTNMQTQLLSEDIVRNNLKIDMLESVDLDDLDQRLRTVSIVVGDDMDVSELALQVENMALAHNLSPTSQSVSNITDVVSQSSKVDREDWVPVNAQAISGPFMFSGTFDNITAFLYDLRTESQTILSLGTVEITKSKSDNLDGIGEQTWSVSLSISGYTALPATKVQVGDPVRVTYDDQVMADIYRRAGVTDSNEADEASVDVPSEDE